jgi:hypothetical protein
MPTYELPATKNNLKAVRKYKGETLRQYIQHFSQMRNKIPRISNEEVISVFSTGVADIKMKENLSMNDACSGDIFSPSSWEPQEEGMMNIAARFSLS